MLKYNLLKINNTNNNLEVLLKKHYNNVVYLTRDDLHRSVKDTHIKFITLEYFNNYFTLKEKINKADIIIFVDGNKCILFKNRYGGTGVFNTQTIFNALNW